MCCYPYRRILWYPSYIELGQCFIVNDCTKYACLDCGGPSFNATWFTENYLVFCHNGI